MIAVMAGRTVIAPAQLPAGLVTALIGAPFLGWLLWVVVMSLSEDLDPVHLTARNLSVAYDHDTIIANLDFSAVRGAFTALVGANGSGKSTLLRTLAGLIAPIGGVVVLDGRAISERSTKRLAREIGMLAQAPVAPEGLTVLDLVRQGRYPHRAMFSRWSKDDECACNAALEMTEMVGLRDRALDGLSGGQRQRAWIALALAQETPMLLLDEPTTFLNLAHQIDLMELVRKLVRTQGKTVVAVLHDLNQAARYADTMVMLKAGDIVFASPPVEVMTEDALHEVFDVRARIIPDPFTGAPMCIPLRSQTASRSGKGAVSARVNSSARMVLRDQMCGDGIAKSS